MNDNERYLAAAHAMQSGVAVVMNYDASETTPKHLRVGVNAAMCEHTALVNLLIEKGLFTVEEYIKAQADEMEREVRRYETRLYEKYNVTIRLG